VIVYYTNFGAGDPIRPYGLYGKLQVAKYGRDSVVVDLTTYDVKGGVNAQKTGLEIPLGYSCDLDTGVVSKTPDSRSDVAYTQHPLTRERSFALAEDVLAAPWK
jgi:hypothetical protein